jgi:two-component system chemotaxis response regulator CheB
LATHYLRVHTAIEVEPLSMKAKGRAKYFPVVCVGGSAGGLDAYMRLLQHLPGDMGVAIVIVNHLRTVATHLHDILPRYTEMPVELITERLLIRPNRVFIVPEKRDLHVLGEEFRLKPISKPRGWPDVITVFLRSLTQHWDGKLIAVIVSGYDGDGARGALRHKRSGGHYHRAKAGYRRTARYACERHRERLYRLCSFT